MNTDPIADMLTRIRNAVAVRKKAVLVPHSKLKLEIVKILRREGYVEDFTKKGKKSRKAIELALKYGVDGAPAIADIKRISKPGRRVYVNSRNITSVRFGAGKAILSTPGGLMTNGEAKKNKIGGEILFEIW